MTLKNWVPVLFTLGFVLAVIAVAFLDKGTLRGTVFFLAVVSAIAGMIIRIAMLTKR